MGEVLHLDIFGGAVLGGLLRIPLRSIFFPASWRHCTRSFTFHFPLFTVHSSSLSDLARMAAKTGDLARNFQDFRRLCSHRLLKPVKFLTQTAILNSGSPEPLTPLMAAC